MGRPQFENQVMISAVSNKKTKVIQGEITTGLASGVYERVTIYSEKNTVARVLNMQLSFAIITESGASGNKNLIVDQMVNDTQGIGMLRIVGGHSNTLLYDQGEPKNHVSFAPNDLSALSSQVERLYFDDIRGLQMVFQHTTGVTTTAKRSYILVIEEEVVKR